MFQALNNRCGTTRRSGRDLDNARRTDRPGRWSWKDPFTILNRGLIELKRGQFDRAIAHYDAALAIDARAAPAPTTVAAWPKTPARATSRAATPTSPWPRRCCRTSPRNSPTTADDARVEGEGHAALGAVLAAIGIAVAALQDGDGGRCARCDQGAGELNCGVRGDTASASREHDRAFTSRSISAGPWRPPSGNADKVKFFPLEAGGFPALQNGQVDLLVSGTTTMGRALTARLDFVTVILLRQPSWCRGSARKRQRIGEAATRSACSLNDHGGRMLKNTSARTR